MSFDSHRTLSLLFSALSSSISTTLSGSCSTSFQPRTCADPHGLGGEGFSESDPLTGYEPKMVGDKDGRRQDGYPRSSLNKRVLTLPKTRSCTLLNKVKLRKLRVSSPYHTTSHYCLRPRILLKALLRLRKQTWTTNRFVLCWLHHGILPKREASAEGLMSSSSQSLRETCGMALTSEKNGTRRLF